MQEIEAKILEIDHEAIVTKLLQHGARLVFDGTLIADFLEAPDGRRIRLRSDGSRSFITHKRKASVDDPKIKSAEELETEIGSAGTIRAILEDFGFAFDRRVSKKRTSYVIGVAHFDIDTYDGIPTFLEIEAPSSDEIVRWAKILGYSEDSLSSMTMRQLETHYNVRLW